jgi:hypothetical protein
MRRLLCTRRHVPLDVSDEYLLAWADVTRAVESAGGRAWLFRAAGHEDRFMEFVEWEDSVAPPHEQEEAAGAIAQLATFAPAAGAEEWEEAT